uniref:TFIIS N-terminal domain-containing protein n=1 Tax=Arcella intermedia TaxID=1963864 RepID=A0A6B2L9F3_9EUKA
MEGEQDQEGGGEEVPPTKKRKSSRVSYSEADIDDTINQEAEEAEEDDLDLDRPRKSRSKRKTSHQKNAADEDIIERFIIKMESAYLEDKENVKKNIPTFAKVKMLPEVQNFFIQQSVKDALSSERLDDDKGNLDSCGVGLLKQCSKWLLPLPDGTLPNLKVREGLLKSLEKLDLGVELLRRSGIGRSIMMLSKHKDETIQNKKICKNLIQKWSRPIFSISTSYSQPEIDYKKQNTPKLKRKSSAAKEFEDAFEKSTSDTNLPRYTVRPEKARMDYTIRPPVAENYVKPEGSKAAKPKFQEKLQSLKVVKKAKSRAVTVGVNKPTHI